MKKGFLLGFTALILLICLLPLAANIFGYKAANRENRPLARKPELITRDGLNLDFPSDFDDYWSDHFGFREELVTAFHSATLTLFNDTLNEKVVAGKEGFLFYSETLNDYAGIDRMSDDEIAMTAASIRLIMEYAESKGARFVFSAAPNKNTIYPEYMPDRIKRAYEHGSNRERLYAALKEQSVDTIDFAALLTEHKGDGLLYYQQDTHWNQRGAIIAYNAIMKLILTSGNDCYDDYAAVKPTEKTGYSGDLHNFVLPAESSSLSYPDYGIPADYATDAGARPQRDPSFGTTSGVNKDKALLLYRDSFGEAIIPLLSSNLGRAVYSQEFPYNLTLADNSSQGFDLIMIELVERNIPNLLSSAPFVPAVEKQLPEGACRAGFTAEAKQKAGYTQLCGNVSAYSAAKRIYVKVACTDGAERVYEAFPVSASCDGAGQALNASEMGYMLTLPYGIDGEASAVWLG